jgi:hypothetical protein
MLLELSEHYNAGNSAIWTDNTGGEEQAGYFEKRYYS